MKKTLDGILLKGVVLKLVQAERMMNFMIKNEFSTITQMVQTLVPKLSVMCADRRAKT